MPSAASKRLKNIGNAVRQTGPYFNLSVSPPHTSHHHHQLLSPQHQYHQHHYPLRLHNISTTNSTIPYISTTSVPPTALSPTSPQHQYHQHHYPLRLHNISTTNTTIPYVSTTSVPPTPLSPTSPQHQYHQHRYPIRLHNSSTTNTTIPYVSTTLCYCTAKCTKNPVFVLCWQFLSSTPKHIPLCLNRRRGHWNVESLN